MTYPLAFSMTAVLVGSEDTFAVYQIPVRRVELPPLGLAPCPPSPVDPTCLGPKRLRPYTPSAHLVRPSRELDDICPQMVADY